MIRPIIVGVIRVTRHFQLRMRGGLGACPWGRQVLDGLSVPIQGVHLRKEVVAIGAPLILIMSILGFTHIFRPTRKLSNPTIQDGGNIGESSSFLLAISLSPYPRACDICHSRQPHVGIISIFAKFAIALGATVMDDKNKQLGPVHMGSRVPLMFSKSQHRDKSPNFWTLRNHWNMVYFHWSRILIISCQKKNSRDLCWELGLGLCSTQLSTQNSQALTSKKCCHVDIHVILGTWDPMWHGKSNFNALNNWGPYHTAGRQFRHAG